MYIFKRHNLGLMLGVLLLAVVSCRGETPALPSPSTSTPRPTITGTPTLHSTPSPTDIIATPTISTPSSEAPCLPDVPIEDQAREALADWLGISSEEIEVLEVEEVEWPDASLGCPQPGMVYAQVIVPGYRVVMKADDEVYEYHAGDDHTILCHESGGGYPKHAPVVVDGHPWMPRDTEIVPTWPRK